MKGPVTGSYTTYSVRFRNFLPSPHEINYTLFLILTLTLRVTRVHGMLVCTSPGENHTFYHANKMSWTCIHHGHFCVRIPFFPLFREICHNMGLCYLYLKNYDRAEECFIKANVIQRHDSTYMQLGKLYTLQVSLPAGIHGSRSTHTRWGVRGR